MWLSYFWIYDKVCKQYQRKYQKAFRNKHKQKLDWRLQIKEVAGACCDKHIEYKSEVDEKLSIEQWAEKIRP